MERMCKKTCRLCRPSTSETRKRYLPLLNDDSKLSLFSGCRSDYQPVCGENGRDYPDKCEAQRAGVRVKCNYECYYCRSSRWSRRRPYDSVMISAADDDDVPDGKEHNKRAADDVSDEKEHKKSRSKESKKERKSKKSRSKKSHK